MTTTERAVATPTIHDFTVTVDTRACEGDRVVLRLDRAGLDPLFVPCSAQQLVWLLNDPSYFEQGYRFTTFKRVSELRDAGESFDSIAGKLGVDAGWAQALHAETLAAMAAQAGE